ncbi:MAG: endonuclease MutS2 [Chloroflexi bacterium]|nr:endonuclease MutS2 [Chloroflexota bacterium]
MTRTSRAADPETGAAADPDTLRALEFGAIVERLASLTGFEPSRELASATIPVAHAAHVGLLNDQTDEADRLLDDQAQANIGSARDIRAALDRASRGGRLTPSDLLEIGDTLAATERFAARLKGWNGPHLGEVRATLDPAPELAERIARSVDEGGEILDGASAELASIRKRMRTAQDRVRERLAAMLRSSALAGLIGEPIVTIRDGRYVIPIRVEAKGRVKGIVHDQSASGATLFIEPLGVVDLNNAWTEATLAETAEIERILDELSAAVEARAGSLRDSLAALARADLWLARARLASAMDAVRPAVSTDAVELLSARHPLIGEGVVPIDLRLGDRFGYRALVVTGPNTGGKTVSLKTLGLLALMHQAGLRVPAADGARLPVFTSVMADIGDEQSIAQSLSTFSSHLRNIVRFVADAGPGSLVLLDEVGAGTDPAEGSALAMAVVAHLVDAGAMVAATTHYAELKTFATEHPNVTNAAVEFDVATLRPTYRLTIGLPGKSQAFAIAERLGLPAGILADARARISVEHATMEEALAAIASARDEQTRALEAASSELATAAGERKLAREGVARARTEARAILADAQHAADQLLARAEREVADLRREVTRQRNLGGGRHRPDGEALSALGRQATRAREGLSVTDAAPVGLEPQAGLAPEARVGMWGRSRTLGTAGRIVEISGRTGRVTLETDGARLVIPADDVEVTSEPASGPTPRDSEAEELRRRAAARVSPTLNLQGQRVEEAMESLTAYLDDVLLAGLDAVTIIHGVGTGAIRRAVREALREHPRVRGFRGGRKEEGGEGATVVDL